MALESFQCSVFLIVGIGDWEDHQRATNRQCVQLYIEAVAFCVFPSGTNLYFHFVVVSANVGVDIVGWQILL